MYLHALDTREPTIASLHERGSPVVLLGRQATTTIISTAPPPASCAGQYSGGALAGAVLGTFFGTLLAVYLFSVIQPALLRIRTTEEVVVEKRRSRHKSSSGQSSVRRPSAVYSTR